MWGLACIGVGLLVPAGQAPATRPAETHRVEAEALVGGYGQTERRPPHVTAYAHASNGASVYLYMHTVSWSVEVRAAGTYRFWLRARSGWRQDRFFAAGTYDLVVGERRVPLDARRETLDYFADGENFVWLCSEPIRLDAGAVTCRISCRWEWGHVDCAVLTSDAAFAPPKGNVATAIATVGSTIDVWPVEPYAAFNPRLEPPNERAAPAVKLLCPRNGTTHAALAVRCRPDSPWPAHLLVRRPTLKPAQGEALPGQWLQIHRLATTGVRTGLLAPDALPVLDRLGYVEVAPGCTACLWLQAAVPADATPGRHTGTLVIENQAVMKPTAVPIELEIADVVLPERADLAVFSWWGYAHMPQSWWDDQIAHGTNVFKFIVYSHVRYRFDERGELIGDMDFAALDKVIDACKRTGGAVLPEWYLHARQFAGLECRVEGAPPGATLAFMSPAWQKAFKTLVVRVTDHLVARGVPAERVVHYIFDEYLGERFVAVAKLIRGMGDRYRIFSDLSADLATYRRVVPYVDVWCPYFGDLDRMAADGRLAFLRSTGKPIWFYDPSLTQRAELPYWKYRHKFWRAFRHRLDGCTYWKHQGNRVGTAYTASDGGRPVTSRRYEAWYSGLQDYKLLRLLDRLSKSSSAEAKALLDEAVQAVTAAPNRPALAHQYRARIIRLLGVARR